MKGIRAALLAGLALAVTPAAQAKPVKGDPAENAVQASVTLGTTGFAFCSDWEALYDVAAGQRLVVEWVSARSLIADGPADPVDVQIRTWNGSELIVHNVRRLDDSVVKAGSFFHSQVWSDSVRLYSDGEAALEVRMCPDAELEDATVGVVSFSGYLLDLP